MEGMLTTILTPLVVMLVTWVVTVVKKDVPDWVITTFIVPVVSSLSTWLQSYAGTVTSPWYVHMALGLAGVFLFEFLKNLKNAVKAYATGASVPRISDPSAK